MKNYLHNFIVFITALFVDLGGFFLVRLHVPLILQWNQALEKAKNNKIQAQKLVNFDKPLCGCTPFPGSCHCTCRKSTLVS